MMRFYLFSVVDDVNQPIILVENSAVQRLQTVNRYPIISRLPNTNKYIRTCTLRCKPREVLYLISRARR